MSNTMMSFRAGGPTLSDIDYIKRSLNMVHSDEIDNSLLIRIAIHVARNHVDEVEGFYSEIKTFKF